MDLINNLFYSAQEANQCCCSQTQESISEKIIEKNPICDSNVKTEKQQP